MCQAACQPVLGEISRTVPHDIDKHASAPAGGVRAREHSGQAEPGSTADEPRSPLPAPARKQGYEKWPEPTRPGRAATLARVLEAYEYDKTQTVNSLLSRGSLLNAVDGAVAFERCPGQGRSATAEDLTPYTTRQLSGRLGRARLARTPLSPGSGGWSRPSWVTGSPVCPRDQASGICLHGLWNPVSPVTHTFKQKLSWIYTHGGRISLRNIPVVMSGQPAVFAELQGESQGQRLLCGDQEGTEKQSSWAAGGRRGPRL